LKEQGTIRGIGASSHNPRIALKMVETGLLDTLMFSINPAFDLMPEDTDIYEMTEGDIFKKVQGVQPMREKLYKQCEKNKVALTAMKPLGAGKLLSKEHSPFGKAMSAAQCIAYVLDRPAVISALPGCATQDELQDVLKYFSLDKKDLDYSEIIAGDMTNFQGACVYCNHCLPCPADIDIASVNRYLDIALLDKNNIPPSVKQHYRSLKTSGKDCIQCGSCEKRCPFSVPIISKMAEAAKIFN
jgi:predicted aldo/keto reductase-like oxidoreductase